ncbi:hypothetical protein P879_10888 [Paragonimus westermani]|uniref:Uncharacterized protein n=1 Tax=Paragonimus westermani TaxID=34504 RepID=A0A8T0DC74_9TREM|nr:hypothetical protein P879_10888 [Paragonimus westermani]
MHNYKHSLAFSLADLCLNHVASVGANCIALQTSYSPSTRVFKMQPQLWCPAIYIQRKMRAVAVIISFLVLFDNPLGEFCLMSHIVGRQQTQVHYSILATDDFLRKYDPSCVTYEILLANQVARSPAFENRYYLTHIKLENRSRTQPAGPSKLNVHFIVLTDVSSVRKQFVSFLHLDPNNGSYIKTERRRIYREPQHQTFTRMEAQITFNNSMLAANGINYTCPPFKVLVTESLNSRFFHSNTSYLWIPVNILEVTPDGRSTDAPTSSPASEQTSTSSDSFTTVRTTTRGGVGELMTLVFNNISLPPQSLCFQGELTLLYELTNFFN